jgi:hypothetical protein
MRIAFGAKAHSGWAALVCLGDGGDGLVVIDRRRIELAEGDHGNQPFHAAQPLAPAAARALVARSVHAAERLAVHALRAAVKRAQDQGHVVGASAVLVGASMPDWSVEEILAVHFRMHKAEGVLYRDALIRATRACGLRLVAVPEKALTQHAEAALGMTSGAIAKQTAALGKCVGPPWGKDQKEAALAALVALRARPPDGRSAR